MHLCVVDSSSGQRNFPHTFCTCRICLSISVFNNSSSEYWNDLPYIGAVYGVVQLNGFGGGGCWYSVSDFSTYHIIVNLTSPFS